ncbi:ankyrin repeat-containing domain protein [Apiospora hydei]|uniref:Ankyrin repeat-containing domain protein n=1 Tax=Apiospora hydei TaxID=1337664 RepID=A0ABR1UQ42_9PEZI
MATSHRNARIPHEKWETHKAYIVEQYVDQHRSLDHIVGSLKSRGLNVTKDQLSRRLTNTWRVRKKAPKGDAGPLWRYVDYQIAERRKIGKPSSSVRLDGTLLDSSKVTKETGRYSQSAWSTGIVQSLKLPSSIGFSSANEELLSKWRDLTVSSSGMCVLARVPSRYPSVDSNLRVPESTENEAARRMGIIRSGTVEEALQEQLKLLFLQASNKSIFEMERTRELWVPMVNLIKLMDFVGFMRKPLVPGEDTTLLAAREGLFQRGLYSLASVCEAKRLDIGQRNLLDDSINTISHLVKWLLLSGQDPNIPVRCTGMELTSALQTALNCELPDLADILLQYKADVRGNHADVDLGHVRDCWAHLPPLVLAIACGGNSISKPILSNLGNPETALNDFLSFKPAQYSHGPENTYGPDIDHPLYDMMIPLDLEADALAVLEYIKGILGPSWFKTLKHSAGILFYASRAGNLGILEFLVHNSVDINITNRFGATALHNAVLDEYSRHRSPYTTCKYLLEHGAVLDSSADMSAFHLACFQVHDVETLRLLCFHGASVHETITITPTATKWLWGHVPEDKLLELAKNSTPLKAVLNNQRLDPQESAQFCLQMAQSTDDLNWMIDAVLQSANIELLLPAIRSGSWQALGFDRRGGLLCITMQCCDYFLNPRRLRPCCERFSMEKRVQIATELLDAGVEIGPSDAVRAVRLGDWKLAERIRILDPLDIAESSVSYLEGTISFLEATILWCPRHAFEAMQVVPYHSGALCAAAFRFGKEVDLDLVKGLLARRSLSNSTNLDAPMEMAAVGIALYNEKWQLLEVLQENLPTQGLARIPGRGLISLRGIKLAIKESLWWHKHQLGSVSCFALDADQGTFASVVQQYGWDTVCLSLVIEKQDFAKAEVLLNHQSQRQDSLATSTADQNDLFPR